MSLKAWIKSKVADKALLPIRMKIIDHIDYGYSLLEVGCGTGDLLFQASEKISHGLGVELDPGMVKFANKKVNRKQLVNIMFTNENLVCSDVLTGKKFDVATATLCFHTMKLQEAVLILKKMVAHSSKVIIADFGQCKSFMGTLLTEIDELFSGHYLNFKAYQKAGAMDFLIEQAGVEILSKGKTMIDGIGIWVIKGHVNR